MHQGVYRCGLLLNFLWVLFGAFVINIEISPMACTGIIVFIGIVVNNLIAMDQFGHIKKRGELITPFVFLYQKSKSETTRCQLQSITRSPLCHCNICQTTRFKKPFIKTSLRVSSAALPPLLPSSS